jgi:hypothetical protein
MAGLTVLTKNISRELCEYWVSDFEWKKHEKLINSFSNFKTNVDGIEIHFIKEIGKWKKSKTFIVNAWLARINCRVFRNNKTFNTSRRVWR